MTDLQLDHTTPSDPNLTHQVIFGMKDHQNMVSCNCRTRKNPVWKSRFPNWIGPTHNSLEEARALYNDPANHLLPFAEEDKAKW